jgi:hypothetical protein
MQEILSAVWRIMIDMSPTIDGSLMLKQLSHGTGEPILVADFQAWSTSPKLSELLSHRAEHHPVYRIDPVGVLSQDLLYVPLPELASACVAEFLGTAPADGRVFLVGHCSASALTLHIAKLLGTQREVTAILVGPVWPDEYHVRNRFDESARSVGAPETKFPDLPEDPAESVTLMADVLFAELNVLAAKQGLDGTADAFSELLAWYRSWLAFLLACSNDSAMKWDATGVEIVAVAEPGSTVIIPGLQPGDYPVVRAPSLAEDAPITPELADIVLAQLNSRSYQHS